MFQDTDSLSICSSCRNRWLCPIPGSMQQLPSELRAPLVATTRSGTAEARPASRARGSGTEACVSLARCRSSRPWALVAPASSRPALASQPPPPPPPPGAWRALTPRGPGPGTNFWLGRGSCPRGQRGKPEALLGRVRVEGGAPSGCSCPPGPARILAVAAPRNPQAPRRPSWPRAGDTGARAL